MAGALFWLSDEAWSAIEPHLPKNQPGARRVDDRRVISGIVHCSNAEAAGTTVRAIAVRQRRSQSLEPVEQTRRVGGHPAALMDEGWIAETAQIDSSYVKARRCSGGAKRGGPSPGL